MKYKFVLRSRYRIEYEIIGKIIEDTNKKFSFMKYLDVLVPFLCKKTVKIINGGALMIFSSNFVSKLYPSLLDETYINSFEDVDLYFRIFTQYKPKMKRINFQIKDIIRGSLGKDEIINYKIGLINQTYFNYKWRDYLNRLRPQDLFSELISSF
ncbi:hypothetical protein [Acidianus sp. RZ1]|uniref:hypothetical protein n=1 Tax=Acidianus sp. RZ1 TaxID=1540082 RepID=UPI001492A8DD|nr:hypothetical protein [Acidianus sp. RZ1]NON61660.1 hypothetical protein [Acidianus sp. RZ1]